MYTTTQQYLDAMQAAIRPGTRGAPARRDLYARLIRRHNQYVRWMDRSDIRRSWVSAGHDAIHPEQLSTRRAARGLEFSAYHYERAIGNQIDLRKAARERAEYLAWWGSKTLDQKISLIDYPACPNYDYAWQQHIPDATWIKTIILARRDDRVSPDGSVVEYRESTEWEKYGARSYPRVCNRRLECITESGSKVLRYLDVGERAETAIDDLIPGRAERRKIAVLREAVAQETAYKVVARRDDGTLVSVYSADTTYSLGVVSSDDLSSTRGHEDICHDGGIFYHLTPEAAIEQKYPDGSANASLPRVLVRGLAWGRKHINGKRAAEYFQPVEIVRNLTLADSR